MAVNWSWPKATALLTVQAGAHALLGPLVAHGLLGLSWLQTAEVTGSASLVAFLSAVIAYQLPAGKATAAISATVSAAQDAATTAVVVPVSPFIGDADEARGSTLA
jgi:hypothetical protein